MAGISLPRMDVPCAPVQVEWQDLDPARIRQHARSRHAAMLASGSVGAPAGAYGRSTPRMQEVGLAGEYALAHWLASRGCVVELIGDDPGARTAGDVAVVRHHASTPSTPSAHSGGRGCPVPEEAWVSDWVTCEVKTSREPDWQVYARTLDAAQLARCTANAYVWAVIIERWGVRTVRLMGWLPVDDIRGLTAVPDATRPDWVHGRPHVRVHAPMRPMAALPDWIAAQPSALDLW